MKKHILVASIILVILSLPVNFSWANINLNTLLTTEGLNKEGLPVTFKNEFSLSEDKGVQYYVEWEATEEKYDVEVKWFNPRDQLISSLTLEGFTYNIVRDYISFFSKNRSQLVIPEETGEYSIYLYIDGDLMGLSKFNISK